MTILSQLFCSVIPIYYVNKSVVAFKRHYDKSVNLHIMCHDLCRLLSLLYLCVFYSDKTKEREEYVKGDGGGGRRYKGRGMAGVIKGGGMDGVILNSITTCSTFLFSV